ncbi:MAG: GNAT family N-acetyltransferase [Armatimonadota bacterium]
MSERIEFIAVPPERFEEAIELWLRVFSPDLKAYFENYYYHDPWYVPECSRAVLVNGVMASAVHICRRPVRVSGETMWMGGIANVATLEQYRRRGFSSKLLRQCVEVMERLGVAFSTLGTGVNRHYAKLGWISIATMHPNVTLREDWRPRSRLRAVSTEWEPFPSAVPALYTAFQDRLPVTFLRDDAYFRGWWYRRARESGSLYLICGDDGEVGYLVVRAEENSLRVHEMAIAEGLDTEAVYLIADLSAGMGKKNFGGEIPLLPGWIDALRETGELNMHCSYGTMFRPVCMTMDELRPVLSAYQSKLQPWWDPDGF